MNTGSPTPEPFNFCAIQMELLVQRICTLKITVVKSLAPHTLINTGYYQYFLNICQHHRWIHGILLFWFASFLLKTKVENLFICVFCRLWFFSFFSELPVYIMCLSLGCWCFSWWFVWACWKLRNLVLCVVLQISCGNLSFLFWLFLCFFFLMAVQKF